MIRIFSFVLTVFLLSTPSATHAREPATDVNYVELAARLLADGHYDRARIALQSVREDDSTLDHPRYHTIGGLIELRTDRYENAVASFERALEAHERRNLEAPPATDAESAERREARQRVNLYLGQARVRLGHWKKAVAAFDASGAIGDALATVHELRAQAWWELKDHEAAFAALDRGATAFPGDHRFLRRRVFYFISLGFYRHAAELGRRYLELADARPTDYVAIGSALRKSEQYDEALTILERARLLHPESKPITLELAHTYLAREQPGAAADIFAEAAILEPSLVVEAAELQHETGRFHRALLLNAAVADQARKLRQRLSFFIAMERWESAAAMGDALRRNDLLADDSVRYAYAYALFKMGDYPQSDDVLGGIARGEMFRKATALRKAMETCRTDRWRCR